MNFIVSEEIEEYCVQTTTPTPALLRELAEDTQRTMELPQMLTGSLEGRFLKMLVQMLQAKRILEFGMFTGYGTLSMAEGLPRDGKIYTCEPNAKHISFAQKYFNRSEHGPKIEILEGPALETVPHLKGPIDFAFIDADKVNYPHYYEASMALLRPGGIIAIDNALREGNVLRPNDEGTLAIDQLNRKIAKDPRVESVLLTVRDGILLVRKK